CSYEILCCKVKRVTNFLFSDSSAGNDVTQTPLLWTEEGGSATMECSHTKDHGHFQIYWYRQLPGRTMELVVFTSTAQRGGEHDFGAFSQTCTLTIQDLSLSSSAVYFSSVQKPLLNNYLFGNKLYLITD
uniref:Immunoglobulin V-set domain-containing protein n=1 Tax=Oryzias latipes TaxID=8090 RepID=A0A3B3I0G9_ORYLA